MFLAVNCIAESRKLTLRKILSDSIKFEANPIIMFPQFLLFSLSVFGLYDPYATVDPKPRNASLLQRLKLYTCRVYWATCTVFLVLNIIRSLQTILGELNESQSDSNFLAFLEALFMVESNRGTVTCLLALGLGPVGLNDLIRHTRELIAYFRLENTNARRFRKVTVAVCCCVFTAFLAIELHTTVTWSYIYRTRENGATFAPFGNLTAYEMIPLFVILTSVPELLGRMMVVLVFGCGLVLYSGIKVIRGEFLNKDVTALKARQREYCVLANVVDSLNVNLGSLVGLSLFMDIVLVCGRITRLLFSVPDRYQISDAASIAKHLLVIVFGLVVYINGMCMPFILLHKEVRKLTI